MMLLVGEIGTELGEKAFWKKLFYYKLRIVLNCV